jgi:hypothetical protein
MKRRLLIVMLFGFCRLLAQDIGSDISEVRKQLPPGVKESAYKNTITLSAPADLQGLESYWNYRFTDNKLDWKHFHKYLSEVTRENFDRCLEATRKIIKAYTLEYGKPDTVMTGNTQFIDPFKEKHPGYPVLEARWNNIRGARISAGFIFMGGKGEYNFLVKVNYFSKDYPYFD